MAALRDPRFVACHGALPLLLRFDAALRNALDKSQEGVNETAEHRLLRECVELAVEHECVLALDALLQLRIKDEVAKLALSLAIQWKPRARSRVIVHCVNAAPILDDTMWTQWLWHCALIQPCDALRALLSTRSVQQRLIADPGLARRLATKAANNENASTLQLLLDSECTRSNIVGDADTLCELVTSATVTSCASKAAVIDLLLQDEAFHDILFAQPPLFLKDATPAFTQRYLADPRGKTPIPSTIVASAVFSMPQQLQLLLDNERTTTDRLFQALLYKMQARNSMSAEQLDALEFVLRHPRVLRLGCQSDCVSHSEQRLSEPHRLFIHCVRGNKSAMIKMLLREPQRQLFDPAAYSSYALREAVSWGHKDVIKTLLLDGRADPRAGNGAALARAAQRGDVDCVVALLADGRADPNADDSRALRVAVARKDAKVIHALLDDPRTDAAAWDNYAVKHAFGGQPMLRVLQRLLALPRVDPSANNSEAVYLACKHGDDACESLRLLLADPRVDPFAHYASALQVARSGGARCRKVKQLLESSPHYAAWVAQGSPMQTRECRRPQRRERRLAQLRAAATRASGGEALVGDTEAASAGASAFDTCFVE